MTVLAPAFLLSLLALPALLLLALLRQRPQRRRVASTEIWAAAIQAMPTQSATRRSTFDRRLIALLVAMLALGLAAAGLAVAGTSPTPREVRVLLDRSWRMQLPSPGSATAFDRARAVIAELADGLTQADTLTVGFEPAAEVLSGSPAEVLAGLDGTPPTDADALRLPHRVARLAAWASAADHRLAIVVTAGGSGETAANGLQVVRLPLTRLPLLTDTAFGDDSALVTLSPNGATAPMRVEGPLGAREVAPDEPRRILIDLPDDPGVDRAFVRVPGAWPPVRAAARWRFRLGVVALRPLPAGSRFVDWLRALFPSTDIDLIDPAATSPAEWDGLVVVAPPGDAVATSLPIGWRHALPMLLIGIIPSGTTAFGSVPIDAPAIDAASAPRVVLQPGDPRLAAVNVARLPLGRVCPFEAAIDVRATPLLAVGGQAGPQPVVIALERGDQRAVALPLPGVLAAWPAGGTAPAMLIGNALRWLIDDARILTDAAAHPWRAGTIGGDPALPPRSMRLLSTGGPLMFAPFDAPASRQPLTALPRRAGWLTVGTGDAAITVPQNVPRLVPPVPATAHPPSAADLLDGLPPAERTTPHNQAVALLLVAAVTLAALAGPLTRRRRQPRSGS